MDLSPSIGKIFGIEIELHWTFLLLLLFTFLLSIYLFFLIVLLFVCVLLHELAHSITSIRNGIRVKKIILLPIGGASIIDNIAVNPQVEFNIAIAGPIMSLFLAGIFGMLAILSPPGIIRGTMQVMFEMNVLLGVFNLLPAFPMDGGRVFRSYLQKKRSFYDATLLTVKVSKYLMGIILIGTFAFLVFGESFSLSYREFVALWNFIIVMFLYSGAQAEEESVKIKKETEGLRLRSAITKHFIYVKPNTNLYALYRKVLKEQEHIVITKLKDRYAYVDLRKRRREDIRLAKDAAVPIPSMRASAPLADALSLIGNTDASIIAVLDGKKFLGIATLGSIESIISLHMLSGRRRKSKL
ncbi:MAG: site-2 protease family protein [Candidatus Micrarchaeia archaeon]|jgi:Zn-dependent protease